MVKLVNGQWWNSDRLVKVRPPVDQVVVGMNKMPVQTSRPVRVRNLSVKLQDYAM